MISLRDTLLFGFGEFVKSSLIEGEGNNHAGVDDLIRGGVEFREVVKMRFKRME